MFLFTLERVFGVGALMIEKTIMEDLYLQLCFRNNDLKMKFENEKQFNFINYVNALKKTTCINEDCCRTEPKKEKQNENNSFSRVWNPTYIY